MVKVTGLVVVNAKKMTELVVVVNIVKMAHVVTLVLL